MFSWLPYFSPKLLGFSCIRLLVCFRVISPNLLIEFPFVVLECSVFQYCFNLCRYLFNLPSFASIFWFISSCCFVIFSCVAFSFMSLHDLTFFLCLIILAYFRRFFICVSNRISHPGFDFFLMLFMGIPILSQTNFAPAEISSFNLVISFVDIYVSTSFIFSVSILTVLHPMFLFKFSRFDFCSCVSICFVLFGSELFGCVVFLF